MGPGQPRFQMKKAFESICASIMRLNVTVKAEHSEIGSSVAWSQDGQLLSCADDKVISRWNADGEASGKITSKCFRDLCMLVSFCRW